MRILLSMPNDGQSNNYIINALQDLNHDVFFVDHRNNMEHCMKVVPEILLRTMDIDLMLVLYLIPEKTYNIDTLRKFKCISPNTIFASWIFDVLILPGHNACDYEPFLNIIKEYDFFFTVAKGHVDNFRKNNVNAFWAREGCCPYSHRIFDCAPQIDVTFIGQVGHSNVHNDRLDLLKSITERFKNTKIYGMAYDIESSIVPFHVGRPTYNDVEHSKVVCNTKINIGHSGWNDEIQCFSARNYRICASSGFLLANNSTAIRDTYDDDEVATYVDTKDCLEKIEYYLDPLNSLKRENMRFKAYKKTIEKYTFKNSLKTIIKSIYET